jgi:hypothetical protein
MARIVISPAASHTRLTRPATSRERLSVESTPALANPDCAMLFHIQYLLSSE